MRVVNVFDVELEEGPGRDGFWFRASALGPDLAAARIGAAVYEARAGLPVWPYHYHYGVEEWLYVVAGQPVLREPGGERALSPGDLVCFPVGHLGAHATAGPGRFVIFSTGQEVRPWLSVYPDSDKISGPGGILRRDGAVAYWHREGTGADDGPVRLQREPDPGPPRPVVNVLSAQPTGGYPDAPAGFLARVAPLGPPLGAERLGATLTELDPGEGSAPYHFHFGREEWLLVLAGRPSLRHPLGTDTLAAGDIVCFPEGPDGAHRVVNRSGEVVRVMFLSTMGLPTNIRYPDSGKWMLLNGSDAFVVLSEAGREAGYWDGES
jgi:uncharacterized cupin superfamily protein